MNLSNDRFRPEADHPNGLSGSLSLKYTDRTSSGSLRSTTSAASAHRCRRVRISATGSRHRGCRAMDVKATIKARVDRASHQATICAFRDRGRIPLRLRRRRFWSPVEGLRPPSSQARARRRLAAKSVAPAFGSPEPLQPAPNPTHGPRGRRFTSAATFIVEHPEQVRRTMNWCGRKTNACCVSAPRFNSISTDVSETKDGSRCSSRSFHLTGELSHRRLEEFGGLRFGDQPLG